MSSGGDRPISLIPQRSDGTAQLLHAQSCIADLPLYDCQLAPTQLAAFTGRDLADWFARYPRVPGILFGGHLGHHLGHHSGHHSGEQWEGQSAEQLGGHSGKHSGRNKYHLWGLITRQQVLELAILPEGNTLLTHPLDQIWGYLRGSLLVLPGTLSITAAMQRAVLRASDGLGDPVVVRTDQGDRLLDFPTLSIADWQIRGIETQVRYERMQVRSIQNEKMASLGRLMDGVAHQILDPVGFIWGNLSHVQTYAQQLLELVEVYQQQIRSPPIPPPPPQSPPIQPSSIQSPPIPPPPPQSPPIQPSSIQSPPIPPPPPQSPPIQPPSIQPQDPLQESQLGAGAGRSPDADALAAIADLEAEIDLDFLRQDLPQTLASIRNGADRLRHIVTSLQNFCHLDEVYPKPADLNHHLDSIILLLQSRLAVSIHFERHYATLPPVVCYIGQLTQVFANVLSNAVETLLDQAASQAARPATALTLHPVNLSGDRPPPCIEVRTALIEVDQGPPWVSVQIADNGPGLPPGQAQKLLSAWAEVRRLGKETSLATSYAIVTAKHGGVMELRDRRGGGLEVEIRLPLVENS